MEMSCQEQNSQIFQFRYVLYYVHKVDENLIIGNVLRLGGCGWVRERERKKERIVE